MPTPQTSRSWFARNALWVVPVGCLGLLAALAAFAGLVLTIAMGSVKATDAYREAVDRAKASPQVLAALGEPVKSGWFVSGKVNVSGPSGDADLSIPLSGPKGKGTLYATARKQAGRWRYEVLEVEVEGRKDRIDLMPDRN
jgi:Cytochrome oxidase complex assembly protein 1